MFLNQRFLDYAQNEKRKLSWYLGTCLWGSGHWWKECRRGMRIRWEWSEHIQVTSLAWKNGSVSHYSTGVTGGPPTPCQPHDQERPKDYTPAISGTGQILGDSSRTTLGLCFPGVIGEVSPVSGLPWIPGAFLGVPEGTGARLRRLRSQDMVTETTEWKAMVTDNIWGL